MSTAETSLDSFVGAAKTFAVRIMASVLAGAGVTIGAIYFIVNQSTVGVVAAIEQQGKRIDDTNSSVARLESLLRGIDANINGIATKVAVLETKLDIGFNETKSEILKKARLDFDDPVMRRITFANLGIKIEERARLKALQFDQPVTVFLPGDDAWYALADRGSSTSVTNVDLTDPNFVEKLADYYIVPGFTAESILKAAEKETNGVSLSAIAGNQFSAYSRGGQVVVRDQSGKEALVQGVAEVGPYNLSSIKISSVFDNERFGDYK